MRHKNTKGGTLQLVDYNYKKKSTSTKKVPERKKIFGVGGIPELLGKIGSIYRH